MGFSPVMLINVFLKFID